MIEKYESKYLTPEPNNRKMVQALFLLTLLYYYYKTTRLLKATRFTMIQNFHVHCFLYKKSRHQNKHITSLMSLHLQLLFHIFPWHWVNIYVVVVILTIFWFNWVWKQSIDLDSANALLLRSMCIGTLYMYIMVPWLMFVRKKYVTEI